MRKLSVCPSVKRQLRPLRQNERNLSSHCYITWEIILIFWQKEWLVAGGCNPYSTWNFGTNWPCMLECKCHFQSIFARNFSADVTPSKKVQLTHRKSTTRFPVSLRLTSYVVRKPPEGLKSAVSSSWTISWYNSETVRDTIGWQLLLINGRMSHTGFRLIPKSMTLNGHERRNNPYFAFFSLNSIAMPTNYITWLKIDKNVRKYRLPVPVFHFGP